MILVYGSRLINKNSMYCCIFNVTKGKLLYEIEMKDISGDLVEYFGIIAAMNYNVKNEEKNDILFTSQKCSFWTDKFKVRDENVPKEIQERLYKASEIGLKCNESKFKGKICRMDESTYSKYQLTLQSFIVQYDMVGKPVK